MVARQRLDLGTHFGKAFAVVVLACDALADRFIELGGGTLAIFQRRARLLDLFGKAVRAVGQGLLQCTAGLLCLGPLGRAAIALGLQLALFAWKPLITASVVISTVTPRAMPRIDAIEINEMKPLRRLARR
ncbi:hypothetical protein QUF31_21350 [Dickeya chrysanthemi]|uniref:hypothetical protein n=1 Tax=Dickeya chrysanthemi TaxID=556 RepID=UPI0025A16BC9|nr:hypothetical protein [Dickeya chrysanthemi]WJM85508.1 hypothetical protein QUF31_21350 [Dickeya chrysanthemi]